MTKSAIGYNLRVRGCPACHHLVQCMEEHFAELQGMLSRSEDMRMHYADEGGFCPLHTWQLAQFSSPRGISRGHVAIIRRLADHLDRLGDVCAAGEPIAVSLKAYDGCKACRFLADKETYYIKVFCAFLEQEENLESYERSHGLCLRHLQQVLALMGDNTRQSRLLRLAANRLREIGESMTRYDQKHEDLKRELITLDEKDAYRRGLVMLSGERTVVSPFMKRI